MLHSRRPRPPTTRRAGLDWGRWRLNTALQRKGIGRQLINEGLRRLREWNAAGCIVVGDPNYYQRFGFRLSPALTPAGQPPEYFMMLSLTASGKCRC